MMGMTDPETIHYGMWDGSSLVICAYALTLILLAVKRREFPKAFMLFVPASVLFLSVIYFPGIYSHLPFSGDGDERQAFRRFRWLFMMLPTLSFGMTYIFTHMKRIQRVVAAAVCAMLMFVSVYYASPDGQTETGFWDRGSSQSHLYHIPNISIRMGDTIMERDAEFLAADRYNRVTLFVSDGIGLNVWDRNVNRYAKYLRMYLSPVQWTSLYVPDDIYAIPDLDIDEYMDGYVSREYDYVLCKDDDRLISIYEGLGYEKLWSMEGLCFLAGGED